jgi:two-component system chemotaxis sensor kinase CheA
VRANVERLGGRVSLRGDPGRGLVVRLALPLTLAVLDAMLVEAGGATYVLPLASVVESATAAGAEMRRLPSGGRMIRARGGQVALLDLGAALGGAQRPGGEAPDGFVVLCETAAGERIALEVDHILGRQQVVMKSIETHFERIEGVAGATLLSDGSLAVVLDVEGLARAAERVAAPAAA